MASDWKSGLRAYRLGMPVPLLALATFSFALLVVGVGIYASAFPSMLVAAQSEGEPKVRANLFVAGDSGVGLGLEEPEPAELADGSDADGAEEVSEASGVKGLATLASPGTVKGSSSLQSAAVSGGQSSSSSSSASGSGASGSGSAGSHTGAGSGTSSSGGSSSGGSSTPSTPGGGSSDAGGSGSGVITDKNPPAEQENAVHEFMLASLSGLDGYVNDVNECVATFNSHALTADLATREADFKRADRVWSKIRGSFASVMNYTPISNYSKWRPAQEGLIGAHRCLSEYLACYLNAWELNVEYDSPAEHEGEFMGELAGAEAKLSEFNAYYSKVSL